MLRISIKDDLPMATMRVEGKLVGPWAMELGKVWHDLWVSATSKPLRLDIRELTYADQKGTQVLREIFRATNAEILAESPLTQYFATQVKAEAQSIEPETELVCRPRIDTPASVKLAN